MAKIEYFGYNHTDRGHYLRPNAWMPVAAGTSNAALQQRLQDLVDKEPRLCRVWVRFDSGVEKCVFWYQNPKLDNLETLLELKGNDALFVSVSPVFEQAPAPDKWVKVKARTIDGAKRLAVKLPSGPTFTARVATCKPNGELEVVASMDNSAAITRRRATWRP